MHGAWADKGAMTHTPNPHPAPFLEGDRVEHVRLGRFGTVEQVADGAVFVAFDTDGWTLATPDQLAHCTVQVAR